MTLTRIEPVVMPALALRGLTIFPGTSIHFDVGREISIRALDQAMAEGSPVFMVAQRDMTLELPDEEDLYRMGTISRVRQILRMPGGGARVMVEGESRGWLRGLVGKEPYLEVLAERIPDPPIRESNTPRTEAMIRQVYELLETYISLSDEQGMDVFLHVLAQEDPGHIADHVAQNIVMRPGSKQMILEELDPIRRLEKLLRILRQELLVLEFEREIHDKTQEMLDRSRRTQMLREQLRVIQNELGEGEDELLEYREKIAHAGLPEEVEKKLQKELGRLEKQPFGSAEASVIRGYLDVCLELPWKKKSKERTDIAAARRQLDADHFGLDKVKERILEFLAVKQLTPTLKSQVLCLVGPPGVGKTSVAMSVAKALNRKLGRISLGGVHDEAEIRGHRKTYIGAMPGRIIEGIRQAGTCNPVLILDEIDKVGSDHRGDPAAALLEVLDTAQNTAFRDHFLEVPFDLSQVLFITTANTTDSIPKPLLDRMEVIELTSYTDEEKLQIGKNHLLPRQRKEHGLKSTQLKLTDDAIRVIIRNYTRESGVRLLERELASLCRKTAKALVEGNVKQVSLTEKNLEAFLGIPRYHPERLCGSGQVGVVNGLAWTSVGGELLEVEVNVIPGSGKLELTGNLGDVMKESARTALSYIRGQVSRLGIEEDFYKSRDIHVHFPEGATPKDGPSAGIAVTTAMVSALTGQPVRGGIAMTGEVTLRGRVLPIGGLKEKTMAALRNGIHTVLIPRENEKDLEEIDQTVRARLRFQTVEQMDEVLSLVLETPPMLRSHKSAVMPASKPRGTAKGVEVRQ